MRSVDGLRVIMDRRSPQSASKKAKHQASYLMDGNLYVDCLMCGVPTSYGMSQEARVKVGSFEKEHDRSRFVDLQWVNMVTVSRVPLYQTGKICDSCASVAHHKSTDQVTTVHRKTPVRDVRSYLGPIRNVIE